MRVSKNYIKAVEWIAINDEPNERDLQIVSEMVSVLLIADLFNKDPISVAFDVVKLRSQ